MDIDKTAHASATLRALEFAFEQAGVPIPPPSPPAPSPPATPGELGRVSIRRSKPANDQHTRDAADQAAAEGRTLTPFEQEIVADAHAVIDRDPGHPYLAHEVYVVLRRGRRYYKVLWLPLGQPDDGSGAILHYVDRATGQVHDTYRRPIPGRVVPGGSEVPAEVSAEMRELKQGLASIAETRADLGELRERLTRLKSLPPNEAAAELAEIRAAIEQAQGRLRDSEAEAESEPSPSAERTLREVFRTSERLTWQRVFADLEMPRADQEAQQSGIRVRKQNPRAVSVEWVPWGGEEEDARRARFDAAIERLRALGYGFHLLSGEVGNAAIEEGRERGIVIVHREQGAATAKSPSPPPATPAASPEPFETAHQRRRRERAEARAARLERLAEGKFDDARGELEHIPVGQPILVGHHSERRHRKQLERHDRKMRAAIDTAEAAKEAAWAAKGAGRAISSDDPEAIEALSAQLAQVEAGHALAKAINKAFRKGGWEAVEQVPGVTKGKLLAARRTLEIAPWMRVPMGLKNSGANIRRIKKRIAELEAAAERVAAPPIEGDGFTITEDPDDNRVRFEFDSRPDKETVTKMKRAGFRWSRTHGAWQRHLNNAGIYAAHRMAKELFGWERGTAPPSDPARSGGSSLATSQGGTLQGEGGGDAPTEAGVTVLDGGGFEGFTIEEHAADNRIRFRFDSKPDSKVTSRMKRAGFRWSPKNQAWQRQLTDNGRHAALRMAREFFGWTPPPGVSVLDDGWRFPAASNSAPPPSPPALPPEPPEIDPSLPPLEQVAAALEVYTRGTYVSGSRQVHVDGPLLSSPHRTPALEPARAALRALVTSAAKCPTKAARRRLRKEVSAYLAVARRHAKRIERTYGAGSAEVRDARTVRDWIDQARAAIAEGT